MRISEFICEGLSDIDPVRDLSAISHAWSMVSEPVDDETLMKEVTEGIRTISKYIRPDRQLAVYRAITTGDLDLIDIHSLGMSWSYERRGAHPYNGLPNKHTVVFHGLVHEESVLWIETLAYYGMGEGEIVVQQGEPVLITNVEVNGKPIQSNLIGQTATA